MVSDHVQNVLYKKKIILNSWANVWRRPNMRYAPSAYNNNNQNEQLNATISLLWYY